MAALTLVDLETTQALNCKAMSALKGRGEWHLYRTEIYLGRSWSGYCQILKWDLGETVHDGYKARLYFEGYTRQKVDTEFTYWNHYVRI
jgi:hypothetical protein